MWEGTIPRVTAADRPYCEFYDLYIVTPGTFGYHLVIYIFLHITDSADFSMQLNLEKKNSRLIIIMKSIIGEAPPESNVS